MSVLGIVATSSRCAFGIDATQTPSDLPKGEENEYSRLDFYPEQVIDLYDQIADLGVSYWVTGGFYAKQKVFDTVTDLEQKVFDTVTDLGGDLITLSVRTRTFGTSTPARRRKAPVRQSPATAKLTGTIPESLPNDSTRWAACQTSPMSACSQRWRAASTLGVTSGSCF